jgi:SAM-dependent methyltransferase
LSPSAQATVAGSTPERAEHVAGELREPGASCLALHQRHTRIGNLGQFLTELPTLLREAEHLSECISTMEALGIIEPLSGEHIPPEAIAIQGPNYRESLQALGCLSRNRAVMAVLEQCYGSLKQLENRDVYLAEAISGFATRLGELLPKLTLSEYQQGATSDTLGKQVTHQNLEALTYPAASFDVVIINEVFEHVERLPMALAEIARVLKPGGRLVATCQLALGQYDSIVKARRNPDTGTIDVLGNPDYHGDPIRPEQGAVVFQIPGWELLDQLKQAGFSDAAFHLVCSWKHGVLGHDIPGVLVLEGLR